MSLFDTQLELLSIQDAVNDVKLMIENAIINGGVTAKGKTLNGCDAKNAVIRSQAPINRIHDAVKSSLIELGVNPSLINPPLYEHKGELCLYGLLKGKNQDVSVLPSNVEAKSEKLVCEGILNGEVDPYGHDLTEHILSINVRSQLSSLAKNFDTLYERTFAESVNLHSRCKNMVLGEVYMIPVYEYDDDEAKNNTVAFKTKGDKGESVQETIEKYISAFSALNSRQNVEDNGIKYERVCLLIVDFSKETPKIYSHDHELIEDGVLSDKTTVSIENLNFETFAQSILETYSQRFGEDAFI